MRAREAAGGADGAGSGGAHLAVEAAGPEQRGVERVRPVGGHEHLDIPARVKAVELVDDLEHGALHLVVAARAVVEARAAHRVHLVEEDDARLLGARELEQLAHHPRALADVLLHELGADHADEAGVGAVGDGARGERLARARRAVEQHALWRVDAELRARGAASGGRARETAHTAGERVLSSGRGAVQLRGCPEQGTRADSADRSPARAASTAASRPRARVVGAARAARTWANRSGWSIGSSTTSRSFLIWSLPPPMSS